jgi:hypothetical protein
MQARDTHWHDEKEKVATFLSKSLDYPGSMSQWEKESLAAEARLSTRKSTKMPAKPAAIRKRRKKIGK